MQHRSTSSRTRQSGTFRTRWGLIADPAPEPVLPTPTPGYVLPAADGGGFDRREVESLEAALEVAILWGAGSLLHVAHLSPARSFVLGEDDDVDFALDASVL